MISVMVISGLAKLTSVTPCSKLVLSPVMVTSISWLSCIPLPGETSRQNITSSITSKALAHVITSAPVVTVTFPVPVKAVLAISIVTLS